MKRMPEGRTWLVVGLLTVGLLAMKVAAHAKYAPDVLPKADKAHWQSLSGRDAGRELLQFREARNLNDFSVHFVLWLDQGRKTSEILAMLRVVGLPLKDDEVAAIETVYLDTPVAVHHMNCITNGYHLDCHGTPGTRLQLTFLDDEERAVYRKWACGQGKIETVREDDVAGELEGRLCVWAADRKIHLGGPHFVYERVARILSGSGQMGYRRAKRTGDPAPFYTGVKNPVK